ncbi:MAG TPA: aromatic ring-hydroxylating dioxygenase subunit alpha [Steroidobacteraceae bacterium]|jgi:phenylpropionate dioxygenase-like ring-hydroxylating dioxygenase large terminal subunit|nr:aromatic ring-hydroxylating dioxygenase subunit alpha [Steroidobacteraceae bacterium]
MPEENSNLVALRSANSPNGFDLRRVGAHPDYWYPLAWSDELKPGRTLGRRFAGEPIVLYRGNSGRVFALEDRCAHRQVPLHLGVVTGEQLKCHYHGWAYDGSGTCVDVPYLGKERLPNGVRSYPAREVCGLIFVFPGDPALAQERAPALLGSSQRRDYKTRRLNREVACHYTFMHENLFDMNHQFMHRKQMGSIRAMCLGRQHGDHWAQVEYSFSRTEGKPSVGEQVIVDLVRKGNKAKKDFTDHMCIRTDYPVQSLKVWLGRDIQPTQDPVLDVWLCYTPLDAQQRTNRTYGFLSVKKPPVPGLIHAVWPFVVRFTENIFREDKQIVEHEQRAYDTQGGDWNNEVFPAIRDLRGVLARCGRPIER